jgi:hypothetical protein
MNELRSKVERAKIERDQDIMQANTLQEVAVVKAEEKGTVLIT